MKKFLQTIAIFFVGAGIITFTAWMVNRFREPEVIERVTEKVVEKPVRATLGCPRSYELYKALVDGRQYLPLLENARMYAAGGDFVNDRYVTVERTGNIACGYLYVRARKNGSPLEDRYESVYINPHDFGGHLLARRSMPVASPIPGKTEILLELNAIPYLPGLPYNPNAQNFRVANWVNLLNASGEIVFHVGLSAADPRGFVEEVGIAYKCWDPSTGLETQDCQLGLK